MLFDLFDEKFREPAECLIKVGFGQMEIDDLYPFLREVVVETGRERPFVATLNFDTRGDELGFWPVQDSDHIFPWQPIVIEAAFGDREEEVMRGYIRQVRPDYPQDAGSTSVTVECQDSSYLLDRNQIRREWGAEVPVSDGSILLEIIGGYPPLSIHTDSENGMSGLVVLQNSTDIRFLRQRAEANGYELIFHEGAVYFGPMRVDADPQPIIMVYAGQDTNCYRFNINDSGHHPDQVAFEFAPAEGTTPEGEALSPDIQPMGPESVNRGSIDLGEFIWKMEGHGGKTEQEIRAMAQQKVNRQSMKIEAQGELDGSLYGHVLRVGEPVGVDGVGDRYSGRYYVDRVTHRFSHEGYRQSFTLLRNAYGYDLSP